MERIHVYVGGYRHSRTSKRDGTTPFPRYPLLQCTGYTEEARELAEKTILLLGRDYERFGALHEYYLPDNGEPVLNKGFQNWNLLVLNMAAWLDGKEVISEF